MSRYNKKERIGQIIFVFCILLAIVFGLAWNMIDEANRGAKPDAVYPITNANISWEQSFHPGGWCDET